MRRWMKSWLFWAGLVVAALLVTKWAGLPLFSSSGRLPQLHEPMPDFTATDVDGNTFRLQEAARNHYLILVFYRGYG